MPSLNIVQWTEQQFLDSESEWQNLLQASDSDQLFLSWKWVTSWWQEFGRSAGGELFVLAAYSDGELKGVAPFYGVELTRRKVVRSRAVTLIGASLTGDAMFSEYLDVIVRRDNAELTRRALLVHLFEATEWDELFLSNIPDDATSTEMLDSLARDSGDRIRYVDSMPTYQVDIDQSFDAYLAGLSGSARRRMFNRRKALLALGDVDIEDSSRAPIEADLEAINEYKSRRWGENLFDQKWIRFNATVADHFQSSGDLRIGRILLNDKPVSYLYNIRAGSTEYNLQSAFDVDIPSSVGLGNLHFGYSIEHAASEGVRCYDLLAGRGRTANYKSQYATSSGAIHSAHVIRARILRALMRVSDLLR